MISIEQLVAEGIKEWQSSGLYSSLTNWRITNEQRNENEQQLKLFLDKLTAFLKQFPSSSAEKSLWKQQALREINKLLQSDDSSFFNGLNEAERNLFQDMTISFLRDVRAFDSSLSLQDTMQALRNIWILAILQCLFQKKSGYHKAMFAYSMLYPYSDNYLDDPSVSSSDKKQFNEWFTCRLKGWITPRNAHEARISSLIQMIENQFPRSQYPDVFKALLLIQNAQIRSLQQQDGNCHLSDEVLLAISYEKGGTSVIADGILIDGTLNEEQLRFCMRFGFLLQLGDDIQDARSDHNNAHQTLLSNHLVQPCDSFVLKLLDYIHTSLISSKICNNAKLLSFVEKDCFYLILYALCQKDAIAITPSLHSVVKQCLPLSSECLSQLIANYGHYNEEKLWEYVEVLISDN